MLASRESSTSHEGLVQDDMLWYCLSFIWISYTSIAEVKSSHEPTAESLSPLVLSTKCQIVSLTGLCRWLRFRSSLSVAE